MNLSLEKRDLRDLDNVSLTAYRIISIFNMLLEAPCSDKEINERLQQDIIGARSLSQDTICIYINTLRVLGCVISRPSKKNDFKYVLKYHPLKLKLTEDELNSLIDLRKYISNLENWKLLVNIDKLFNVISDNLTIDLKKYFSQKRKAHLRDIDVSAHTQLINTLEIYCGKNRTVLINYNSPGTGEKLIEMSLEKLTYENGSLYLWGYNPELEETQYLRVDRIKEIKAINIRNSKYRSKILNVKYKISGISLLFFNPNEEEKIISKSEKEILVEANTKNKFKFIQRILSFGSDCVVLSPESLKEEIISKLKTMYTSYDMADSE